MDFDERLSWLVLGGLIGFALGYVVRHLQEIKEELGEVEKVVKNLKNEDGLLRHPVLLDIVLLIVVVMTVWASFASQRASNSVQSNQDRIENITVCNQVFLSNTIEALNERTAYAETQVNANIDLQDKQMRFFTTIYNNPSNDQVEIQAFRNYLQALTDFVRVSKDAKLTNKQHPFPTAEELSNCNKNVKE